MPTMSKRAAFTVLLLVAATLQGCAKAEPPPPLPVIPPPPSAMDRGYEPFLSQLDVNVAASARLRRLMSRRYDEVFYALPDGSMIGTNSPLDYKDDWRAAIGDLGVDTLPDGLIEVLRRPARMPDGTVIPQVRDTGIGMAAMATCDSVKRTPLIKYNPRYIAGMTRIRVLFLQQHELGHFVKKHITTCDPELAIDSTYKEKEADCWAVAQLSAMPLRDALAIGSAGEYYRLLTYTPDEHYEAPIPRSEYILNLCPGTSGRSRM